MSPTYTEFLALGEKVHWARTDRASMLLVEAISLADASPSEGKEKKTRA